MTRITSLLASAAFLCGAAFGASRAETTTYVDGNITGVAPNTGGTLLFPDDKAVYFRTGLANVEVPYANINKAELGATRVHSQDVPLYKVWSLHKRFSGKKSESQFLTIAFKGDDGEEKTMTLELAQAAASSALSTIESHTGKEFKAEQKAPELKTPDQKTEVAAAPVSKAAERPAKSAAKADGWWGDSIWKTTRNADKWSKPSGTTAPDQQ